VGSLSVPFKEFVGGVVGIINAEQGTSVAIHQFQNSLKDTSHKRELQELATDALALDDPIALRGFLSTLCQFGEKLPKRCLVCSHKTDIEMYSLTLSSLITKAKIEAICKMRENLDAILNDFT